MNSAQLQFKKMTETPIRKLIISLSIPTIISMLITSVYNLADTAFVGQLGNSASGAVGIVFGFMAMIQAVGFMFGQGAGSIVSRLLGKKDDDKATKVASLAFFCAISIGIIGGALGLFFINPLVELLGSTKTIAPYAKKYMVSILFAAPFMVSSFVLNNILRYEGRALLGMVGLLTGALINIALDPILMFGLDMGIAGAGIATAISQFISFCILVSMFLRGKTQCRIALKYFKFEFRMLGNICATGLPSLLRQGLTSITTMILNNEAARYNDEAIAAMSIVSRIAMFIIAFSLGIGQGFQPVSGFNYGAGKYGRVKQAYKFAVLLSELLLGTISICVFITAPYLIELFRHDDLVVEIGTRALRLQCLSLLVLPFSMMTEMLLQSTGKRIGASVLSSLKSGVIFIPALIILSKYRGLEGIQEAQPFSYFLAFIPSVIYAYVFFKQLEVDNESTFGKNKTMDER